MGLKYDNKFNSNDLMSKAAWLIQLGSVWGQSHTVPTAYIMHTTWIRNGIANMGYSCSALALQVGTLFVLLQCMASLR